MNMKGKTILSAIIFFILFFTFTKLMDSCEFRSHRKFTVNYAPEGFKEAIESKISAKVDSYDITGQYGLTRAIFTDGTIMPISYSEYDVPRQYLIKYPGLFTEVDGVIYSKEFLKAGDSIVKEAFTDTFYVIRGTLKFQYIVP